MAAMANIVLADAAATPVNHTFVPTSSKNGVFVWERKNVDAAIGNERITMSLTAPRNGGLNYKAVIKQWLPVLEVTSPSTGTGYQPAPKVAYNCVSEASFSIPQRSALQNRKDITKMFALLLQQSVVLSLLNDLEEPT